MFITFSFASLTATPFYASMSQKAFVFLEALEVLDTMNVISSMEYVVNEESVETLMENSTRVADQESMPTFLLLAMSNPQCILTESDAFSEVLIPKIVVEYKGEHPLEKLELILTLGQLFDKEYKAKELYRISKEEYLTLISFVKSVEHNQINVTLKSDDEWLISLFKDAGVDVELGRVEEGHEPIFSIDKDGKEMWYSFSKRINGYGYSDINSSAILYPQYLLNDIISLLYLSIDESNLTYIQRIDEEKL